jgi:hypothetical protein
MFKLPSSEIRAEFRKVASKRAPDVFRVLGELRKKSDHLKYAEVIAGLKIAAPAHSKLTSYSPSNYRDILYIKHLPPLSLNLELKWAEEWLKDSVSLLNTYIEIRIHLSELLLQGNFSELEAIVDKFITTYGWCVWAIELKLAIVQQLRGTVAMKKMVKIFERAGIGRASGLLAVVISDRNDNKYHFESFVEKCRVSFSRVEDKAFKIYLPYRAIGDLSDPVVMLPYILSMDICSSIFDYYESVVDAIQSIRLNATLANNLDSARGLTSALIQLGIRDFRLVKLAITMGIEYSSLPDLKTVETNKLVRDFYLELVGTPPSDSMLSTSEFGKTISEMLQICMERGAVASEAVMNLIKIGINFKGTSVGSGLVSKGIFCYNSLDEKLVVPTDIDITLPSWAVEDALVGSDEFTLTHLRRAAANIDCLGHQAAEDAVAILDGNIDKVAQLGPSHVAIWLARYYARIGRFDTAMLICDKLIQLGEYWNRQASKIRINIQLAAGETDKALLESTNYLILNSLYAREFPLTAIFTGKNWKDFKECDPVALAFSAHWAHTIFATSNVRFICRMACRLFQERQAEKPLETIWESLSNDPHRQKLLIKFLQNVWVEDNIALIDTLKSTHEVRQERIRILQHLLAWDPDESPTYSTAIKEMTLDETFWQGFQQINETRVFVNEPGITRWAEKELLMDFDRWKDLDNTERIEAFSGELLRNYMVDPSLDKLLEQFPKNEISEWTYCLLSMLDRLFQKFLLDPADGLNSYLSLRIRHGSMRGTLLGPLEHEGLLISGEASKQAFHAKWDETLSLPDETMNAVIGHIEIFTKNTQQFVKYAADEYVQVETQLKPRGYFYSTLDVDILQRLMPLYSQVISFQSFLDISYQLFWETLKISRNDLSEYFKLNAKRHFQTEITRLIAAIEFSHEGLRPLVSRLHAISTASQVQCDSVAAWFVSTGGSEQQSYPLSIAIEIAKRATSNIYRQFPENLVVGKSEDSNLPLSSVGLSVIFDSLCIVFENAWKHSGLGESLGAIELTIRLDKQSNLLHLNIISNLSPERCKCLKNGELEQLRQKNLAVLPVELVPKEGGSGFAKLAAMVSMVSAADPSNCQNPIDFGITTESKWFVNLAMPFYRNRGTNDEE